MIHCQEVDRLKQVIRQQEQTVNELTEETRDIEQLSCSHTNAAIEALDHLGEWEHVKQAREVDCWLKVDAVRLLCEVVMAMPAAAPPPDDEWERDQAAKDRRTNEQILRRKERHA